MGSVFLALVLYSVKRTTWLISVCVAVTVSFLTVYWWSANGIVSIVTIVLRLGASSISVLIKGHVACSAVRVAVLMILLVLLLACCFVLVVQYIN